MGSIFSLITDEALDICEYKDYHCDLCSSKPAFSHCVETKYEGEDREVDFLCASCIKLEDSKQITDEWEFSLSLCQNSNSSKLELEHTPKLPCFIQEIDWPVCCGELCEFEGVPSSSDTEQIPKLRRFWFHGVKNYNKEYGCSLKSEFLKDIGFFRCNICSSKYFTFQFM